MRQYIGIIHKDPTSDYGVSFPDFPGCITAGSSLEEARGNAEEALPFHISGMAEDGHAIPEPSSLDAVMAHPDFRDGVAILVPVREAPSRAVRINISIEERLLEEIDRAAKAGGSTRSGFLAEAARRALRREAA